MPRPSPVTDAVRNVFEGEGRHAWTIDQLHEVREEPALGGCRSSGAKVLPEKGHHSRPGILSCRLVVRASGLVEERVSGAGVDLDVVVDPISTERRVEGAAGAGGEIVPGV